MRAARWSVLMLVSLVLSLTIPVLYGGMESLSHLQRLPAWGILLLLGMVLAGWCFNGARLWLLTRSLGYGLRFPVAVRNMIAAEFAGSATPANAGNSATYVYLLTRQGVPVGPSVAVLTVDTVVDLVFFATAVPIAVVLFALGRGVGHPLAMAGLILALSLLGLAALGLLMRHYRPLAIWVGRRLNHGPKQRRIRYRLARWLIHFRQSLHVLMRMGKGRLFWLFMFCVGHWMLRYGTLPVVLILLGYNLSWGFLFAVQAILMFAGKAVFLPGGGGGVEVGYGLLLSPYLDATTTAASLLLWRFFNFYGYLIAGAPMFLWATGGKGARLLAMRRREPESYGEDP